LDIKCTIITVFPVDDIGLYEIVKGGRIGMAVGAAELLTI
jgi:hypothetical protein